MLAALQDAGIENVDEDLITKYFEAIDEDNEAEDLADIQELINEANKEAGKEVDQAAAVKAVEEAGNQVQLLNALSANFERVNKDWIVGYSVNLLVDDELAAGYDTFDKIQDEIDRVNEDKIDETKVESAADQAKVTALIEMWMKPDTTTPKVTAKAEAIEASKLAEAAYKVVEANTANRLYNALVSFADLADDEDVIDPKGIKEENKAFYFANLTDDEFKISEDGITATPEAIVAAGNTAAEDVQGTLDARIKSFTVYTRHGASSSTNGPNYKLAYGTDFGLGNKPEPEGEVEYQIKDVKSIVVEHYKGKELLGTLTLKDPKAEKVAERNGTTGTLDIFGDYDSDSWVGTWNASLTDFPTESVLKVEFDDGVAEKKFELKLTDEQKQPFFVEAVNRTETAEEMSKALTNLESVTVSKEFTNLSKAAKLEVAELVLEARNDDRKALVLEKDGVTIPNTANKFFGTDNKLMSADELFNNIVKISDYKSYISEVNDVVELEEAIALAEEEEKPENNTISAMVSALTNETYFKEFSKLSPAEQATKAELVLNKLIEMKSAEKPTEFKTIGEIKTAAGL